MRAAVVAICILLLSTSAFAQTRGRGGPNMDPLRDRQHAEPKSKSKTKASKPRRVKIKSTRRTVSRHETAAAPKKIHPPQKKTPLLKSKRDTATVKRHHVRRSSGR